MKIARVEALHCDGGWRPWTFVRLETDGGLVGWGECSDNRSPHGIAGCVRDLADLLVGQDPRPVERLYWDMLRRVRQNSGGVSHKAIAGIELALWDIKAKALGVPVYELFGGPLRDRVRLYWSHCGTTRARMGTVLGTPPLRTYDDI
ncbi:MAG: mandelate racemase/muconate lactonizing protein, partial [Candidatus Rokuibacteriota bacterium]